MITDNCDMSQQH